jgi:hypothetical protein
MERLRSRAVATGGNGWQMRQRRIRLRQPKTVAVGCHQLPQKCIRPTDARRRARFRACQRERPRPLQAAATGPCRDWVASVSDVSVDSNGACRGGSGGAAGQGASRWPSRPAWRSPAGRPAAARRGSPRGIPRAATTGSSPHASAETDQRYRLQRWNRGNEKAPRMRETLRVGSPVWAHSDDYMPKCDDRSS